VDVRKLGQSPEGRQMGHSYARNLIHCVFSTKQRTPSIPSELEEKLWAYLYGIAENHKIKLLAVGGTQNHIHMLIAIPPTLSLSEAVSKLKANSSRWLGAHEHKFSWQEGYGAFSVGASQIDAVLNYIRTQHQHHAKHDFETEFIALLKKYGVAYDPKYVFG
jgi:putative transposase